MKKCTSKGKECPFLVKSLIGITECKLGYNIFADREINPIPEQIKE